MTFFNKNPPTKPVNNEVTVTIMDAENKINYHETFYLDLTKHNHFEYDGVTYNIPPKDTYHYEPSFWRFDLKLALFYEHHKTWAKFTDLLGLRNKAIYEVGYLYWKGTANPIDFETEKTKLGGSETDWARINYLIENNQCYENHYRDFSQKLRGHTEGFQNWWIIVGVIAVAIVVVVVLVMNSQTQPASQVMQNVTSPQSPSPTPLYLG